MYIARTCYDHLAGRVAVELSDALEKFEVIRKCGERDYELGRAGRSWFANLGVDVDALRHLRRTFARQCLDWTERRPHIAGALGAALCCRFVALGWIACGVWASDFMQPWPAAVENGAGAVLL
ncbi:MAG: hypothetical protein ACRD4E_11385 [Bryobacteraceae bacterium]